MKVKYRKKFLGDLARIPANDRKAVENFAFEEVPRLNSVGESGKVERMKGIGLVIRCGLALIASASNWRMTP